MREYRTLKALDAFRGWFDRAGIDYAVMRRILQVKLTIDRRRAPTVLSQSKSASEDTDRNLFARSLWLYALFGLIMVPLILAGDNYIFQMGIVFGIFVFLMATTMISDFSSVLLDVRDRNILGTKPVGRQTLSAARAVHAFIYLSYITGALIAAPFIAGIIRHGVWFGLLFLVETVWIDLFLVVATALIYLFVLKWFDGERLKDTINYVQIVLSVAIMAGYQLLVRSFNVVNLQVAFDPAWWHYLLFPLWFGAPFEMAMRGSFAPDVVAFTVLAAIIPVAAILLYVKLIPAFERNLLKLSEQGARPERVHRRFVSWTARWLCSSKKERAFYRFASSMLASEREFKLKVYPSVVFSAAFPFVFLYQALNDMGYREMANSEWYLSIYFSGLLIPTIFMMLKYSGSYKGAWIYRTSPIADLSLLHRGTVKAAIVRLFAPVYFFLSIVYLLIFGWTVIPHLAAAALAFCVYMSVCFRVLGRALPFSEAFQGMKNDNQSRIFGLLLLLGVPAGIHFMITFAAGWVIWLYVALLIPLNAIVWRMTFR